MTPPLYKKLTFGPEARDYIRKQWEWDDPISRAARSLPIDEGVVFAYVPLGYQFKGPQEFYKHQKWPIEDPIEGILLERGEISEYLSADASAVAISPSILYERDPAVQRKETQYFLAGEVHAERGREICYFLDHWHSSDSEVGDALGAARSWPTVCVLTSLPPNFPPLRPHQFVEYSDLEALVHRADRLLVDAFEDEALLIWCRRDTGARLEPRLPPD